jgi:hypothetical protein
MIDRGLERPALFAGPSGCVPSVDYRVPQDLTSENYLYYLEKKIEFLGYN